MILSLNGRDKKLIYSACYDTWHGYEDGECGGTFKRPGCFIVFETDIDAKSLNEIKRGPTAQEHSDEDVNEWDTDEEEEEDF